MQAIRKLFSPRDMTVGTPWKRILGFAIPMLVGNVAQQLYNTVDTIVVGRYVGSDALAAVGRAFPLLNFMLALFVGVSMGAGILVSQYFGAKNRAMLTRTIGNCLSLTGLAALATTIVGFAVTRPLMEALGTPERILDWSVQYMQILFLGITGALFYNVLAGILRGLGDSLSALAFLILATLLNIVLDLWFVISFGWGVAGVAWATILSQTISAILCYLKLNRMRDVFALNRNSFRLRGGVSRDILRLGLPAGVTQAIFSIAMILAQPLQNRFGPEYLAMSTILMRVDGFAMMPNFSFGQTMTTFVGQNVGARKVERLQAGTRQGLALAVITAMVLTASILLFGREIMSLFMEDHEIHKAYIINTGMRMMAIMAIGYVAMAFIQTLSGAMRGAGDTRTPMMISIFTSVILRLPLSYLLIAWTRSPQHPNGWEEALFIVMTFVWVTGAVINLLAFKYGKWRQEAARRMDSAGGPPPVSPAESMEIV